MKHTRRGFFATLLAAVAAPLVAKVAPKRKFLFNPECEIDPKYLKGFFTAPWPPPYKLNLDYVPMLELWPKPMTAAKLIQNAYDQINSIEPATPVTFAELNAMLDKWGAICSTNGPGRLRVISDSQPL